MKRNGALKDTLKDEILFPTSPRQWKRQAQCLEMETEMFFPSRGDSPAGLKKARKTCSKCRVSEECLAYALSNAEAFGIWGGLTERERRLVKQRLKKSYMNVPLPGMEKFRALANRANHPSVRSR